MSRMDGVSFFHTLFSANLNTGNLVPEGLSERELRMNIILTGADGDDISADLEQVRSLYGVLAYNKTSSIDVVGDVIKPHISFVESRLRDVIRRGHNGGWPSSVGWRAQRRGVGQVELKVGGFPRRRRHRRRISPLAPVKRASERSADGSFSLASVGGDSFSVEHSPLGPGVRRRTRGRELFAGRRQGGEPSAGPRATRWTTAITGGSRDGVQPHIEVEHQPG